MQKRKANIKMNKIKKTTCILLASTIIFAVGNEVCYKYKDDMEKPISSIFNKDIKLVDPDGKKLQMLLMYDELNNKISFTLGYIKNKNDIILFKDVINNEIINLSYEELNSDITYYIKDFDTKKYKLLIKKDHIKYNDAKKILDSELTSNKSNIGTWNKLVIIQDKEKVIVKK